MSPFLEIEASPANDTVASLRQALLEAGALPHAAGAGSQKKVSVERLMDQLLAAQAARRLRAVALTNQR
jgi:hypothetical protein